MGAAARMRLLISAPGPVRMEMAELIASSARGRDAAEIARDFEDELLRICADTDNARGTSHSAPGVRTGTGGPLCTLHVMVGMWRQSTYCWRAALE
jgi:hypothetical protein